MHVKGEFCAWKHVLIYFDSIYKMYFYCLTHIIFIRSQNSDKKQRKCVRRARETLEHLFGTQNFEDANHISPCHVCTTFVRVHQPRDSSANTFRRSLHIRQISYARSILLERTTNDERKKKVTVESDALDAHTPPTLSTWLELLVESKQVHNFTLAKQTSIQTKCNKFDVPETMLFLSFVSHLSSKTIIRCVFFTWTRSNKLITALSANVSEWNMKDAGRFAFQWFFIRNF